MDETFVARLARHLRLHRDFCRKVGKEPDAREEVLALLMAAKAPTKAMTDAIAENPEDPWFAGVRAAIEEDHYGLP